MCGELAGLLALGCACVCTHMLYMLSSYTLSRSTSPGGVSVCVYVRTFLGFPKGGKLSEAEQPVR